MSNVVRGDDDVLALLDEMSGDGSLRSSASSSLSNVHIKSAATSSNPQQHCINEQTSPSIAALIAAYQQSPPTNPQIEIIRHRVHEKFKVTFMIYFVDVLPAILMLSLHRNRNQSLPTVMPQLQRLVMVHHHYQ